MTTLQKYRAWGKITAKVDRIADKLGKPIDPGIKETVIALKAFGIITRQSCEGHFDRGMNSPWVSTTSPRTARLKKTLPRPTVETDPATEREAEKCHEEANRHRYHSVSKLLNLLDEFYRVRRVPVDQMLIVFDQWLVCQGAYVLRLADEQTRHEKLRLYQEEMRFFTEFLKQKFFGEPSPAPRLASC